jgi:hypothetical protein
MERAARRLRKVSLRYSGASERMVTRQEYDSLVVRLLFINRSTTRQGARKLYETL